MHKLSLDISQFYRSAQLGQELRHHSLKIQQQYPNYIREVRGRGLFNAVELNNKNLHLIFGEIIVFLRHLFTIPLKIFYLFKIVESIINFYLKKFLTNNFKHIKVF